MSLVRLLVVLCLCPSVVAAAAVPIHHYGVDYHARFVPEHGEAEVRLVVSQPAPELVKLDFNAPAARYSAFEGDGEITRHGDRVVWMVPGAGGELRYRTRVDHARPGGPDARMTRTWAVARLDDLFPPARARAEASAYARAHLYLEGPPGWSFETSYGSVKAGGVPVDTRGRRFDRPVGWFAAGDLGVRRTRVAGRWVAIAGPKDQGFRRMDLLVFLRWTLPQLVNVVPSFPRRLLIVSGSEDMWRGGLSGPGSLYLHPDRPLVSGNSTSPPLHELMHVATEEPPEKGADWIVEGMAEYYSLVILERSGGISHERFQRSLDWLAGWAGRDHGRLTDPSTGADTARAVLLFHALDTELTQAGASLDAVVAELLLHRISAPRLAELTAARLGHPSKVLAQALQSDATTSRSGGR